MIWQTNELTIHELSSINSKKCGSMCEEVGLMTDDLIVENVAKKCFQQSERMALRWRRNENNDKFIETRGMVWNDREKQSNG